MAFPSTTGALPGKKERCYSAFVGKFPSFQLCLSFCFSVCPSAYSIVFLSIVLFLLVYLGRISVFLHLRARYGDKKNRIFFERKTHHEKWIEDTSVKERFDLPLDRLDAYMQGKWVPTLRDFDGNKSAAQMLALALEIQSQLMDGHDASQMVAAARTGYDRTAFQAASNNDVRLSLDTDLWCAL